MMDFRIRLACAQLTDSWIWIGSKTRDPRPVLPGRRDMRKWILFIAGLAAGCDARFVDYRPASERSLPAESSPPDLAGVDLSGIDLSSAEKPLAEGTFVGRAGHAGTGTATLVQRLDGGFEVRFGSDFSVSNVPGPAVFLTSRMDMGASIDTQADINLGTLAHFNGAQTYSVPSASVPGRRNVFVFCQPFRVEVSKAALIDSK